MSYRFFRAELNIYVNEAQRTLYGKGTAGTKKLAAQNCSLSLVRQLFHVGAIEAAEQGQIQAKRKKLEEVFFLNLAKWINPSSFSSRIYQKK